MFLKIFTVDWDVHHGNGIQKIFYNDPNVLYFSVHRYHGGRYFPFLPNAGPDAIGSDEGVGFNMNVGWNQKGLGDKEYKVLWDVLLMPVAHEFQPDIVLVSAGFDAGIGDMGEMNVSSENFGYLTKRLMTLANGRVVCSLEGGYLRSMLSKSVASVISALLTPNQNGMSELSDENLVNGGINIERSFASIEKSASDSIFATVVAHGKYWNCLRKYSNA